jgi:ribosomal-protein-alanine N-acetyltransferase
MNPLNFIPFPNLTTERLVLRQLIAEDEAEIFKLRSDESVSKFLTRPLCKTMEEARAFINKINTGISNNESLYWALTLKNNNALIGTICIWNISKEHARAEVGFELLPDFQGKGFMQEALTAVLDYGFNILQLHSIEGVVSPGNLSSIKILGKNNFVREAYFKENFYHDGKFIDTAVYSLLNPDNKK